MTVSSTDEASIAAPIRRLAPVPLIDQIVFGDFDWIADSAQSQNALRHKLIADAFDWHLENCPAYRRFAERVGQTDAVELTRIPQLPVSLFKRGALLSVPSTEIVRSFTSSGTSGRRSQVLRDEPTLNRLSGMMRPENPLLEDIVGDMNDENSVILNLGPPRRDTGNLWFAFVMSLVEQLAPTKHFMRNGILDMAGAAAELPRALERYEHVLLTGPPFLVASLGELVRGSNIAGGFRLSVFTGGGWKTRQAQALEPVAFREQVRAAFGLRATTQVRDVFNQVELNSLFVECHTHNKHLPPWVHAFARDPATFEPLPSGEVGVLSYSDASARSFPCFIISDDLGAVHDDMCACGRAGLRITQTRRLRQSTHNGCADSMASMNAPRDLIGTEGTLREH